tara:strand:+ start:501 stop:1001 length:501 start_codon:yes stop_codon:yes gene_type:complete
MNNISLKNFLINLLIILFIFLVDRISKIYILNLAELKNSLDIYITSYLNLFLIWNKGIAFGFFSINGTMAYNVITCTIATIIITILVMMIKNNNIKRYFYALIVGGALGNLYDRIYYTAVPDFIDLHYQDFHWFVFNVADIFITIGVLCLILVEVFNNNKFINEKN